MDNWITRITEFSQTGYTKFTSSLDKGQTTFTIEVCFLKVPWKRKSADESDGLQLLYTTVADKQRTQHLQQVKWFGHVTPTTTRQYIARNIHTKTCRWQRRGRSNKRWREKTEEILNIPHCMKQNAKPCKDVYLSPQQSRYTRNETNKNTKYKISTTNTQRTARKL